MKNIVKQDYHVSKENRNFLNGHRSFVIWFTGLSGSGKSTIANQLEKKLFDQSVRTFTLDGDNIRHGLSKDLAFSKGDRHENNRRISEVAKLFVESGIVTITAFISPLKEDREQAKEIIGNENFFEIYVDTPIEICEQRDVKGLYQKVRKGEISNFTGIDSPYEAPTDPFLIIKTVDETVEESVEKIFNAIADKLKLK